MKIVIIEDEFHTSRDLSKTLIAIEPEIEIVAILESVEESIEFFTKEEKVDLIFSDIELGDGLSFEIFNQINNKIPVIFCTAYNQYALDAFKSFGIEYILKPFDKISIYRALEKYSQLKQKIETKTDQIQSLLAHFRSSIKDFSNSSYSSLIVQVGDKIIPIQVHDFALFYIENGIVYGLTFQQKKYQIDENLKFLEEKNEQLFFRANKQFLINRKAIKEATHSFNRHLKVCLIIPFSESIVIGRLKTASFLNWLSADY
ncbi:MAG: LytR/AlgR family response regulator transcription factor [Fluviicola sp.]|jgi:DNA-binding LytR/AlgR family response regulator